MRRAPHLVGLVALTLVGAALRFGTLGARGYWLDEIFTVDVVHQGFGSMLRDLGEGQGGAPLYFLVAWPWAKVFGTSEVGLRSLSALVGTLTVPVAYAAARQLASRRVALIAAALAAFSPVLVWFSQDARPYALLVLLGGASFALFARAMRTPGGRPLAAWAVVSAALIVTHYLGAFMVAAESLLLLRARGAPAVRWAVGAQAALILLLVPLAVRGRQAGLGNPGNPHPVRDSAKVLGQLVVGFQPPMPVVTAVAGGVFVLVALALLARRATPGERAPARLAAGVAAAAVLLPLVVGIVTRGTPFLARYLGAGWVPAAVVAAMGFGAVRAGRLGAAAVATMCALFAAVVLATAWKPKFEHSDWRGAARALGTARVDRAIVVGPDWSTRAFRYYRQRTRVARRTSERLREIVVVGLPDPVHGLTQKPHPPRPKAVGPPAPGFELVSRREADSYTVLVFRSRRPSAVWLPGLARAAVSKDADVLTEPALSAAR